MQRPINLFQRGSEPSLQLHVPRLDQQSTAQAQRRRKPGDDAQDGLEAVSSIGAVNSNHFSLGQTDPAVAADMGPRPEALCDIETPHK